MGFVRRVHDRGATTVEYALIVAVLVLGSLGGLTLIEDRSGEYYSETADDIGELPDHSSTSTTAPGTTTTAGPGTTTTAPPATTTTAPATTTTVVAHSFIDQLEDRSFDEGKGKWKARVRVNIHRDDTGATVVGAFVIGTFTSATGAMTSRFCVTNSNGRCDMSWGSRTAADAPVLFEVTNVVASPSWDGSTASILLSKP